MSAPVSTLGAGRLALYSLRYSVARGYHYAKEREVTRETGSRWLSVFKADEPHVDFIVASADRPPIVGPHHKFLTGAL